MGGTESAQAVLPPHDVLGLREPETNWAAWLVAALGALILAYLVWRLAQRFLKRPVAKALPAEPAPVEPKPHERLARIRRAIAGLDPAEGFDEAARERFYFELSHLFRELIEARTGEPATGMTSAELRPLIVGRLPLRKDEADEVTAFLAKADQIKFAAQAVSREAALDDRERVVRWSQKLAPEGWYRQESGR